MEVSGDKQVCSTLSVWPISSATRVIEGYLGDEVCGKTLVDLVLEILYTSR